jgi:hypothetical protein
MTNAPVGTPVDGAVQEPPGTMLVAGAFDRARLRDAGDDPTEFPRAYSIGSQPT